MVRGSPGIIISWFLAILGIIILVIIANVIAYLFPSTIIIDLVSFLNRNVWFLILSSVFFYLAALFYSFGFPINILTPPSDGAGSIFIVGFLINLIAVTDKYSGIGVGSVLKSFSILIYIMVFILVVIFGYVSIAQRQQRIKRNNVKRVEHYHHYQPNKEIVEEKTTKTLRKSKE